MWGRFARSKFVPRRISAALLKGGEVMVLLPRVIEKLLSYMLLIGW